MPKIGYLGTKTGCSSSTKGSSSVSDSDSEQGTSTFLINVFL